MQVVIDQMQRQVALPALPQKIISLVPSLTELLYELGLSQRIVGVTKFCVHPAQARKTKTIIGGTKQFRMEVIHHLYPDLIIGNKEENYREGIESLSLHYPVWMSDITTLEDALQMILSIGNITGTEAKAFALAENIRQKFVLLKEKTAFCSRPRVLYLIWRRPWMAAGKNTFIDDMLQWAGWQNVLALPRYPVLTEKQMTELAPDWVFLSSEPFPFGQKHIAELRPLLPKARFQLVEGQMFSWYGSRLLHSADYFASLQRASRTLG